MSDDDSLQELLEYVESELGFATSHYNNSYLDRRVSSRVRRTTSDGYGEYFQLLKSDPEEQEALLDAMSINVTGFFRNPDVWEGIRKLLQSLAAENNRLHAWSAPCADGREPYSLAMLAHDDPQIDATKLSIVATDISDDALETARNGVYQESRTTDISEQLSFLTDYESYVDHADGTYTMAPSIKRNISFEHHDLINGNPKSGFDLVMCRNLFIYIDNEYKQTMLETIANSLRPGGYLVIGKAETIPPELKPVFETRNGRLRIYQRTTVPVAELNRA